MRKASIYRIKQATKKARFLSLFKLSGRGRVVCHRNNRLAGWDDFRKLDWVEIYEYPGVVLEQVKKLMGKSTEIRFNF